MKTETKRDHLLEFIIGYVERGDYGFNFATVHKPCRECGTGFQVHREIDYHPGETAEMLKMATDCLILAPHWASSADIQAIKKYKNWEDYTSQPINNITPKVEIS